MPRVCPHTARTRGCPGSSHRGLSCHPILCSHATLRDWRGQAGTLVRHS
jgi:hypothetical protein